MFARIEFNATTLLGYSSQEAWCMPLGHLLDMIECYKQYHGISHAHETHYIDELPLLY